MVKRGYYDYIMTSRMGFPILKGHHLSLPICHLTWPWWSQVGCGLCTYHCVFIIMVSSQSNKLPAWISNHMPSKVWDQITYPFPNFNSWAVEVWEWISNVIPHFIMNVIIYSCWNWSWSMSIKGASDLAGSQVGCVVCTQHCVFIIMLPLWTNRLPGSQTGDSTGH